MVTLSEIKSEHSDGVVRRELAPAECANSLNGPRHWRVLVQRQGCASVAIIPHGREENVAQVSFAEDDEMIKTFLSARANQSFRMPILPRRSRGS